MKSDKVNEFLEKLERTDPYKLHVVEALRSLFLSTSSGLHESIKYGGIVYSRDGTLHGGIFPYTHHISVEFSNGAKLSDPEEVLEGSGTYRRHIKIMEISDLEYKQVGNYLKEALAMA